MDHDVDPSGECYVSEGRLSPAASSIGKKHSATPAGVRTTNRRLSLAMEEVFDQVCVCVRDIRRRPRPPWFPHSCNTRMVVPRCMFLSK